MRRVALLVGINRYEDERINDLSCCAHDAQETAFTLRQQLGFDEALALTERVTAESVMEQLATLGRRLRPGDLFVFFFAGHGKTHAPPGEEPDQLFLLPRADVDLLSSRLLAGAPGLLSWRALKALTDRWAGVQRLFIFDACRLPLEASALAQRGTTVAAAYEGGSVFRDVRLRRGGPQSAGNGAALGVFNSCDDGQQAEELPQHPGGGHGRFTAALLEEFRGAVQAREALLADAALARRVHQRMQALGAAPAGPAAGQQPLWAGDAVLLHQAPAPAPAPPAGPDLASLLERFEGQLAAGRLRAPAWDCCIGTLALLHQAGVGEAVLAAYQARVDQAERRPAPPAKVPPISPAAHAPAPRPRPPWPALAPAPAQPLALSQRPAGFVFRDADWAPEMVVIPAGKFVMGSPESEPGRFDSEGPQRKVTIERPYAMGRCVVTFDEYERYVGATGADMPNDEGWGRGRRPVINVSWHDAQAYIAWLNQQLGLSGDKAYRLPTEAEWEYAARARTTTAFWWGDEIDPDKANYDGSDAYEGGATGVYRQQTVEADAFEANPWGLYQVHGNVWEWVQDPRHDNYHGAPATQACWEREGYTSRRVVRGGSWGINPGNLRSANRYWVAPDNRFRDFGFRLARTL